MTASSLYKILSLAAVFVVAGSVAAQAQLMPGCDSRVWDAQKAKSEAKIAVATGQARHIIGEEPSSSVLELSCFDAAAGETAREAGAIFSGDFVTDLDGVANQAYTEFVSENFDGSTAETVCGSAETWDSGADPADCDCMKLVYDEERVEVNDDIEIYTEADLETAAIGGDATTNDIYSSGTFAGDLTAAKAALPSSTVPSFAGDDTLCDVLATAGMVGPCP